MIQPEVWISDKEPEMAISPYDCINIDTNDFAKQQILKVEDAIDERLFKEFTGVNSVVIRIDGSYYPSTITILAYKYAKIGWHVTWLPNDTEWILTFKCDTKLIPGDKAVKSEEKDTTIDLKKNKEITRNIDLN